MEQDVYVGLCQNSDRDGRESVSNVRVGERRFFDTNDKFRHRQAVSMTSSDTNKLTKLGAD